MSHFRPVDGAKTETTASIVIELIDSVTDAPPRDPPRVRLRGRPETFTRTPSGYFVVNDLPEAAAPVTVTVDDSPQYLSDRHVFSADDLDSVPAVERIDLLPAPGYSFHAGATLVRGSITTGDDPEAPLAAIDVTIDTDDLDDDHTPTFTATGRSDARGEYVLFVRGITGEDVLEEYPDGSGTDADRVVHVDGAKPRVRAVRPDTGAERREEVAIPEGRTARLDLTY